MLRCGGISDPAALVLDAVTQNAAGAGDWRGPGIRFSPLASVNPDRSSPISASIPVPVSGPSPGKLVMRDLNI